MRRSAAYGPAIYPPSYIPIHRRPTPNRAASLSLGRCGPAVTSVRSGSSTVVRGTLPVVTTAGQTKDTAVPTRRFALSRAEAATSCVAAAVSTGAYLSGGQAYLARGVIGDLLGFVGLAAVAVRTHRRLRHEAALCLTAIGTVLFVDPQWPLRIDEPLWWLLFVGGLVSYVALRGRVCDSKLH